MKALIRLALYGLGIIAFATLIGWLVSWSMSPDAVRGKSVSGSGERAVAAAGEPEERPARVKRDRSSSTGRSAAVADLPEGDEREGDGPSAAVAEDEEPELTADEQKLVDRLDEVQGEDGKFSLVRKLAREAKSSPRVEVRRAACAALGAFSSKASLSESGKEAREAKEALEEQIELFAGDEPEVTTEMASAFKEQMLELDDDAKKVALIEKTATILTDESDLEFMMSEWVNIDDKVAVPSIERVIQSTSGLAHDKAVDAYLLQTSEDYAGAGSAQRWLADQAAE